MNFFKTKPRSPSELVRGLRNAIPKLDAGDNESKRKANEEVTKDLQAIKAILYGDGEPVPELVAQLAQETYATDLLLVLVQNMARFDFESRKDVVQIFNGLLRRQIGSRLPTVEYVCARHEEIIFTAFAGYANEETALNTGMILRDMVRHEQLAKILLYSEQCAPPDSQSFLLADLGARFYTFPHHIETASFGVSCDAFSNLKDILTRHKPMVADFLDKHYDRFFASFLPLVLSWNHVTQRQSLKLLGEILLDRTNFGVMTRFIAQDTNLKTIMNLLRSKSKNVQFEAFHVFKVFVANPKKPPEIEAILLRNKAKLLTFLKTFLSDKEDELFVDEKQFLIVQIEKL
ncbi:Mo25-like protein [Tylopilus felleus]